MSDVKSPRKQLPSSRRGKSGEKEQKTSREKKTSDGLTFSGVKNFISGWFTTIVCVLVILAIFGMKAMEEKYLENSNLGISEIDEADHYKALNLSSGSTTAQIKSAYRKLSIKWHPDRNPGCPECIQKFNEVASAYQYFVRKQRSLQINDGVSGSEKELEISSKGVYDFDNVQNSTYYFYPTKDRQNVWCVLIYEEFDEYSRGVKDLFEEVAQSLKGHLRFGMMGTRRSKHLLRLLPVNVKIFPALLMMGLGMHPEVYALIARPSVSGIRHFIETNFPSKVDLISSVSAINDFKTFSSSAESPLYKSSQDYRVLVYPSATSALSVNIPLILKAASVNWAAELNFGFVKRSDIAIEERYKEKDLAETYAAITGKHPEDARKDQQFLKFLQLSSSHAHIFLFQKKREDALAVEAPQFGKGIDNFGRLNEALGKLLKETVPVLYRENFNRLCKSDYQNRKYCILIMHDADEDETKFDTAFEKVDPILRQSQREYLETLPNEKKADSAEKIPTGRKQNDSSNSDESNEEEDVDHDADREVQTGDEPIHVQAVHLTIPTPSTFGDFGLNKFVSQRLKKNRFVLLDMGNGLYSPLPEKNNSLDPVFVRRIYQTLQNYIRHRQQHVYEGDQGLDAEHEKSETRSEKFENLEFFHLPLYCSEANFSLNCLSSAEIHSFWKVLASFLGIFTQITYLHILALMAAFGFTFYFWDNFNAKNAMFFLFATSIFAGAIAFFQSLFSKISKV